MSRAVAAAVLYGVSPVTKIDLDIDLNVASRG